jgi:hypothetical protein
VKKISATYGKSYQPVLTPDDAKLAFGLGNESAYSNTAL